LHGIIAKHHGISKTAALDQAVFDQVFNFFVKKQNVAIGSSFSQVWREFDTGKTA